MARDFYPGVLVQVGGGSPAVAPNLPFTVWTDYYAGTNVTAQLLDGASGTTTYDPTTDTNGNLRPFRGPDGYEGDLFADTGIPSIRYLLESPSLKQKLVDAKNAPGGGTGVTDHGALSGLGDDDHPQYHNDARGDVRYYPKAVADQNVADAISASSSADRNRANHYGTQTAASISDLTSAVQAVPGFGSGSGGALDTTSTLTSGTASTTAAWSASNTKAQINALVGTSNFSNATKDIVGALFTAGGGSYNSTTKQVGFPAGGGGGSSANEPVDASAAPYSVSTTGTRDANGAGLLAAVQAAGKRGVSLPSGRYPMAASFTDENILIDLPDVTFTQPSVVGDTKPIFTVERTLGAPVAVGPTRIVEWGPRLPGGVSSSAKYTAIDLTGGGYSAYQAGDLGHISSKDNYKWSWSGQNIADGSTSDGLYWQAGYVPILGIGLLVISTQNGGPLEQMTVQGSTSGATGLIMSDSPGNANGGITATQNHILFGKVTGDFQSGENLVRVTGGNPLSSTGGTVAAVGQVVGVVSGQPMIVSNRILDDAYGTVTAANIAAGSAAGYGPGTLQPNQTDNTVRFRKVDRAPICVIRTNFDIDAAPGTQDNYIASNARFDMLKFRGVFMPVFDSRVFNSWTRAVAVTSCYEGRWRGIFDGLPNHAFNDQSAFGYGFECKSASEGNTFEILARNCRHAYTTNPNPRTFSLTLNNAVLDYGTPKHNTVRNTIVESSYTNALDTHPGDYFTKFIDCVVVGGGSGGRYNSDGGAGMASRGFGTEWHGCKVYNSVEGINYLGSEHDPGFDHTVVVKDCEVVGYQARGFYASDAVSSHTSIVVDGGRYIGDGSATNVQYQHEALAIGDGIKVLIKGEPEFSGFNGYWLRMRDVSTAAFQSELEIVSAVVDYRGTTTSNAQGIRVDGTLARAVIGASSIYLRLATGSTPGGVVRNAGGNTAFKLGHVVSERTVAFFQTTGAVGSPSMSYLVDLGQTGGGTGGTSGTQVTIDGVAQSTIDISSTKVVDALYIGADPTTGYPTAGTTVVDLTQLQKTLAVGTYIFDAEIGFQMSATGGGTLRFGFGGPGSANASVAMISAMECTNPTSNSTATGVLTGGLLTSGATATANTNVFGTSPGLAATTVWVKLKARVLVTSAAALGIMWTLSSGATAVPTLKAGSLIEFRKIT